MSCFVTNTITSCPRLVRHRSPGQTSDVTHFPELQARALFAPTVRLDSLQSGAWQRSGQLDELGSQTGCGKAQRFFLTVVPHEQDHEVGHSR